MSLTLTKNGRHPGEELILSKRHSGQVPRQLGSGTPESYIAFLFYNTRFVVVPETKALWCLVPSVVTGYISFDRHNGNIQGWLVLVAVLSDKAASHYTRT